MPETEPPQASARPEDILSPQEAGVLEKAAREELTCPRCEARPLRGEEISTGVYQGVCLSCPDIHCGFVEY